MDHALIESIEPLRSRASNKRAVAGMQLDHLPGDVHLTYCTNIHAGETWSEVRDEPRTHIFRRSRQQVSPGGPLGLGLRLSAIAAAGTERTFRPRRVARAFSSRHGSLRLHHQRLSVRPFSRHARQGERLPARLAHAGTPDLHRLDSPRYSPRCFPPVPGSHPTVPGRFKPSRARARMRRAPWPTRSRGMPRTLVEL